MKKTKYILHLPFGPMKLAERMARETGGKVIALPWRVEYKTKRALELGEKLHDKIRKEYLN